MSGSGQTFQVVSNVKLKKKRFRRPRSISIPEVFECVSASTDCGCNNGSGSGSYQVTTPCCSFFLPNILHGTITNANKCPCVGDGITFEFIYREEGSEPNWTFAPPGRWYGSAEVCGRTLYVQFFCNVLNSFTSWVYFSDLCGGNGPNAPGQGVPFAAKTIANAESCVPLLWLTSVSGSFGNGFGYCGCEDGTTGDGGTFLLTITE